MPRGKAYQRRHPSSRTIPGVTLSTATKQLHSSLSNQAFSNHSYHAAGLQSAEKQIRALGYTQPATTVRPHSSAPTKEGFLRWVSGIARDSLILAAFA